MASRLIISYTSNCKQKTNKNFSSAEELIKQTTEIYTPTVQQSYSQSLLACMQQQLQLFLDYWSPLLVTQSELYDLTFPSQFYTKFLIIQYFSLLPKKYKLVSGQPSLEIPSVHTESEQIYAPYSYGNTIHLQYIIFSQQFMINFVNAFLLLLFATVILQVYYFYSVILIIFYRAHGNSGALLLNK